MDPLGNINRNIASREGPIRVPSRDGRPTTNPRAKNQQMFKTSNQNFYTAPMRESMQDWNSNPDEFNLASLNIKMDETSFLSNTKADILQLQEDINKMDLDGKIRNSSTSSLLKKNHIYGMYKFLSRHSNVNVKKQIDAKMKQVDASDVGELVKSMGVKDAGDGLRKLLKVVGLLDIMMIKMTEYNIVSFLNYDSTFEALRKQFGEQNPQRVQTMDNTVTISRFQVPLANLDRQQELYRYTSKLLSKEQKSGGGTFQQQVSSSKNEITLQKLAALDNVDELYQLLRKGESFGMKGEVSLGLASVLEGTQSWKSKEKQLLTKLQQYEEQTQELTKYIEKLQGELGQNKHDLRKQETMSQSRVLSLEKELEERTRKLEDELERERQTATSQSNLKEGSMAGELSSMSIEVTKLKADLKKLEKIENELRNENDDLKKENDVLRAKKESYSSEYYLNMIKQLEENYIEKCARVEDDNTRILKDILELNAKIDQLNEEISNDKQAIENMEKERQLEIEMRLKGQDTFEEALREQFESMKGAFEQKIKSLNEDVTQIKKDKGREIIELKQVLSREKENRELILRKLQIYTKT